MDRDPVAATGGRGAYPFLESLAVNITNGDGDLDPSVALGAGSIMFIQFHNLGIKPDLYRLPTSVAQEFLLLAKLVKERK
jgi:hypothetical protein